MEQAFDPPDATKMPGYRRSIRIEPGENSVLAMLEDDIHCMAVRIDHAEGTVVSVTTFGDRVPWNTCPGAGSVLAETFVGLPLAEVTARRARKSNCTHLHDLAVLAASHADAADPIAWDIAVSDPTHGRRVLELRRQGRLVWRWIEADGVLAAPVEIAGLSLLTLRDWIGSLSGAEQEAARLLQWGGLVAQGRTMPMAAQSNATALPANCYTLQPERAREAQRTGVQYDFSDGSRIPLAGMRDKLAQTNDGGR